MNTIASANRRTAMRFPGDAREVTLTLPSGAESTGRVIDESFGGLGLFFGTPVFAEMADAVNVMVDGQNLPAVVRSVIRMSDGSCRVGVQWPKVEKKFSKRPANTEVPSRQAAKPEMGNSDREKFLAEIPSGVFKLSALFESGNWEPLQGSLARLITLANQRHVPELIEPITNLQRRVESHAARADLEVAFEVLVDTCLMLAEEV